MEKYREEFIPYESKIEELEKYQKELMQSEQIARHNLDEKENELAKVSDELTELKRTTASYEKTR